MYTRARSTGAWTAWQSAGVYDSDHVAGWVRYADGRQECWENFDDAATGWTEASGVGFMRPGPILWTFPRAFVGTPTVTANAQRNVDALMGVSLRSPTTTNVSLTPWSSPALAANLNKTVHARAVGRWY